MKVEALDVEHVDLVNEEDAGHHLGLALVLPLSHLLVDLLAGLAVSPEKRARKPWVRELMTSISWRETVCTTSLHWMNLVSAPMASYSLDLP